MTVKPSEEVQKFITLYYAAEEQAKPHAGNKRRFRLKDSKLIAEKTKALLDDAHVDHISGLCNHLWRANPDGLTHMGHYTRLITFAKRNRIKLTDPVKFREPPAPRQAFVVAPVQVKPTFDFRSILQEGFNQALQSGMSLHTLNEQASEVLADTTHTFQVKSVTGKLQGLLRESGLSRDQLANIVGTL